MGFAIILADYFFEHGSEEWLELMGCQIVSRITVFQESPDRREFQYQGREFRLAAGQHQEPVCRNLPAEQGKGLLSHREAGMISTSRGFLKCCR